MEEFHVLIKHLKIPVNLQPGTSDLGWVNGWVQTTSPKKKCQSVLYGKQR